MLAKISTDTVFEINAVIYSFFLKLNYTICIYLFFLQYDIFHSDLCLMSEKDGKRQLEVWMNNVCLFSLFTNDFSLFWEWFSITFDMYILIHWKEMMFTISYLLCCWGFLWIYVLEGYFDKQFKHYNGWVYRQKGDRTTSIWWFW